MDHPTRRRRRPPRPVWLAAVLLVALLATLTLAPDEAWTTVQNAQWTLANWLRPTMWTWPLAAALTLAALTSAPACRRWPRPEARIEPGIAMFAVLVALASRPRVGLLALGAVAIVGLLTACVLVLPRRLAPPMSEKDLDAVKEPDRRLELADARVKLQNDLRTTAVQAIIGLAVLAGAVLGFQQLTEDRQQATATRELTVQGQASERFTRAIDQLGSDRREVQLGGIYGLEQIAQQAPANRLAVNEVLVAYLRRRVPRPAKPRSDTSTVEELRARAPDAQAALTVLGRREFTWDDPPLDLRALDLRKADLFRADLRDARLDSADLRDANLGYTDLRGARLESANLRGAFLYRTDLRSGAILWNADLRGANLSAANLRFAPFLRADLRGARFGAADLSGADLRDARLGSADLRHANLDGAKLRGATADQHTAWPDGFDWQGAGVRLETSPGP
jgi:Pentapeptide repeats (8 copies)